MSATDRKSGELRLGLAIFAVTGLLTVLAVVLSVSMTLLQGNRLSDTLVDDALARARTAEADVLAARFRELELVTQLMADDPGFSNVVSQSTGTDLFGEADVDVNSLLDQLDELRERIGFDLGMVLGMDGDLLAHSERPVGVDEWMDTHPLVAPLIEELLPVAGYWQEGERIYQIIFVPMAKDGALIGFLAAGLEVNDDFATEVARISGTELLLLADGQAIASTLPAEQAGAALAAVQTVGEERTTVTVGDGEWAAALTPIDSASGFDVAGVSLISTDRVLAPYRQLLTFLLVGGALIVLLAIVVSLWAARRMSAPLTRLAEAADLAAGGSYEERFEEDHVIEEISTLATALASLLSDLREKTDIQQYVSDLYRYLPDPGIEETRAAAHQTRNDVASQEERHLLALEFRQVPGEDGDIDSLVGAFETIAQELMAQARSCRGQLEHFEGQRAVLSFSGENSLLRALVFAGSLAESSVPPAAALVGGAIGRATIRVGGSAHRLVVGRAVLQGDLLLEESRPGLLLASPVLKDALARLIPAAPDGLHIEQGRLSSRKYMAAKLGAIASRGLELPPTESDSTDALTRPGRTAQKAPAPVAATIETGDLFAGRYEIVSILGQGGMGKVYKAFDRELEDFVALKTLLPQIASDTRYLDQLKEEIKLARRVTHGNVLRTFDFGNQDGVPFISMEYVRGMTLRYLLEQRSQLPFSAGLRIVRQLAGALVAAHDEEVIHRDIKPENVILHASGNAKLMDFGIAGKMQRMEGASDRVFVGTPAYAAPEQMEGRALDPRTDLYACGVLMYELFTGTQPFRGDMMTIYQTKTGRTYPPIGEVTSMPERQLAPIVDKCLEPDPAERMESAAALQAALAEIRG
ncbi:MAG: protein kinase [Pseudomonadota bacterium]